MAAGFDSIPKILAMKHDDFLKVQGFKEKMASKIHTGIQSKIDEMSLPQLMAASNTLGRGLGEKKITLILHNYESVFDDKIPSDQKVEDISKIKGMAEKTSELFVENIPKFVEFMKNAQLLDKIASYTPPKPSFVKHALNDTEIVFTGVRDKNIEEEIISKGAKIGNKVNDKTTVVVTNDLNSTTSKMKDAHEKNITIMLVDDFIKHYNL
jgi:NAD-dependent DNA ligase